MPSHCKDKKKNETWSLCEVFFLLFLKRMGGRLSLRPFFITFATAPFPTKNITDESIIMRALLLVVGKTTDKHISACIDDYVGRIGHYLPFEVQVIPELRNTKSLSMAQQKEREGELILKQLVSGDHVVLLDEHGEERRSVDFASWLEKKQMGVRRLVFVVGGPYGFSDAVYARCNEKISLSRMTFSHQLVRLVFVEQFYRACTIIKGEPYHHE